MELIVEYGYLGLFVAGFIAATVLPFSSEAVFVGMLAAGSDPVLCIVAATLGNWLGGMTGYYLGRAGNYEQIRKYTGIKLSSIEKHKDFILKYGAYAALLAWLPVVGDPLTVALGFVKARVWSVAVFMLVGKLFRYIVWAYLYQVTLG